MPDNPVLLRLARNLRSLRDRRGLSRDALATAASVDSQIVKRIESARANPALVVLSRLCAAMAISLSLLLSGDLAADIPEVNAEVEAFESEAVADTLVTLRKNRGLSQRAVAASAQVQAITLSRYESATTNARLLSIEPIARVLGLDTVDLIRAIELRQQQTDQNGARWHVVADGVRRRVLSTTAHSRVSELRLALGITCEHERFADVEQDVITAIRGTVRIEAEDLARRLRRGATVALPSGVRRLANTGTCTARVLLFEVVK